MRRLAAEYIAMGVVVTLATGFAAGMLANLFMPDAKPHPFVFALLWGGAVLIGGQTALHAQRTRKQRERVANGLCPSCGYDLRASPDRCPECGTPSASQA